MSGNARFYSCEKLLSLRKRTCACVSRTVRRRLFYLKIYVRHIPVLLSSPLSREFVHTASISDPSHRLPGPRVLTPLQRAPRHHTSDDKSLSFGLLNVRSLHRKVDDVLNLQRLFSLDIFLLVETWHDPDSVSVRRLRQEGLTVSEQARPRVCFDTMSTNHGGVAIVSSPRLHQSRVSLEFCPQTFETVCSRITCDAISYVLLLIYRTGSISSLFFEELSRILNVLVTKTDPVFVAGDLNIHVERSSDPHASTLLDIMISYGLHCCVDVPTHDSGGTLDVLFAPSQMLPVRVQISDFELSDHRLLSWRLPFAKSPPLYRTISYRPWNHLDLSAFRSALSNSSLCQPDSWQDVNCDQLASLFDTAVTHALDCLIPLRSMKLRCRPSDSWFDHECRQAKRQVRRHQRLLQRLKRSTSDPHELSSALSSLKVSYRSYRSLLSVKRQSFWSVKVSAKHNSPRDLWRMIDSIMGRGRSPLPTALKANDLKDYFVSKVSDVWAVTDGSPPPLFSSAPPGCIFSSFSMVSVDQVVSIFRSLPNKSSACDPLHTALLKNCIDVLAPFLTHLFNVSLSTGVFPDIWKHTSLKPVMKKDKADPLDLKSYRPISNLCVLSKVLEKLVSVQLRSYLDTYDLIPSLQSAYRPFHSTETAVLKLSMDVLRFLDKGDVSLVSLLDLSSAFDSVDHRTLLQRLRVSFGLEGPVLSWFNSFLTDRFQSVSFGSSSSDSFHVKCGVPQGSVLGPLLFTLYVSDLIPIVTRHNLSVHMYADDIQIYGSCPPSSTTVLSSRVSRCLDDVKSWCFSNRLVLNADKSEVMWCSTKQKTRAFTPSPVRFDDLFLSPMSCVKCLGFLFDCSLTFKNHVSRTVSSCFGFLRQIRSIRRSVPRSLLTTVVTSLVISRLNYCISVLFGVPKFQLRRLQNVQHAAARLIYGTSRYSSISPLLRDLKWLPISARIEYRLSVLVHQARLGRAPAYLLDELKFVSSCPGRSRLRSASSSSLCVPAVRRPTVGGRSFYSAAAHAWNSLPDLITRETRTPVFKKLLFLHLFTKSF